MPIEIQQPMARLYGEAALLTGKAKRDIEREKTARREAEQLRSFQAQKELTSFQHQLNLNRAKFNASMDFEAEKRARLWEIEKMESASRIDFEQQERKRLEKIRNFENASKKIKEYGDIGYITEEQKEKFLFKATMDFLAVDISDRVLFPTQKTSALDLLGQQIPQMGNRIKVISPQGVTGTMTEDEWPDAQAAGYRRI